MSEPTRAPITNYGTISLARDSGKRHNIDVILRLIAEAQAAAWRREQLEAALLEAVERGCGVLITRRADIGEWKARASSLIPPLTVIAVDEEVTTEAIKQSLGEAARVQAKDLEDRLRLRHEVRPDFFPDIFEGVFPPAPAAPAEDEVDEVEGPKHFSLIGRKGFAVCGGCGWDPLEDGARWAPASTVQAVKRHIEKQADAGVKLDGGTA